MAKGKLNDIINSEQVVLIDFFATWCGPCKALHPILQEVSKSMGDKARIIKIDIDKNPSVASKYAVRSVPTLMLFKNGKQLWRESGVVPGAVIIKEIEKHA